MLAELPDLWDVNVAGALGNDSRSARFSDEGFQEPYVAFVKSLTTKPVVGVGRFTSPDTMVRQVQRRHSRFHRRGAAVDRRSVPAAEDPRRPRGRNPRMHRLQHLPGRQQRGRADPLHAEPHNGRGVAARLASGADRAEAAEARIWLSAAGRPGSRRHWHSGGAAMRCMLAEAARELGGRLLRESACRGLAPGSGCATIASTCCPNPMSKIFRESRMTAEDIIGFRCRPRGAGDGQHAGGATASASCARRL